MRPQVWPFVRVRMDDGAVVELSREAAEDIYDLLWRLAPAEGAVTTAAKLHHALRIALLAETVDLDATETARFAEARERVAAH